MSSLKASDSMRMYSWWWDSHISPKNSKWLQENLTEIDSKVKIMIKLIEEDADSFAKRAEMYYKKRPELMKLVEEFYRAYRALAERYDHATGALRQAHHTMAEAFPNQLNFPMADDFPSSALEPHTPEMRKIGFKQLTELFGSEEQGRGRKEVNHHNKGDRNNLMRETHGESEVEIQALKNSLAKLETEKEADLVQYKLTLSDLEEKIILAQEDARGFNERASKAESEVETMKETLIKLQAEKEASYYQYQQCLSDLKYTTTEAQTLKETLAKVEVEISTTLLQYKQCWEKISNLESKLLLAQENARILNERAVRAETEVQFLKEAIAKLEEEKNGAELKYLNSLGTITALQDEVAHAQEEATRLSSVIVMGVAKLNSAEEQYLQLEKEHQSLQTEVDTLLEMMTLHKQELSEKHQELDRIQSCIDEECSRSLGAEAALQTLQNAHSQCQEERKALLLKIENVAGMLKDKENEHNGLQEESQHVKEENEILREQQMSLSIAESKLQDEIVRLRGVQVKLDEEIEGLVDQKNALQQEVFCLKESLDDLKKKYLYVVEQMEVVGLNPDSLGSAVKTLHEDNSKLRELRQKDKDEKESLLKKLKGMENLVEKNALLENSLLDVNAGVELLREKVKALDDTYQSLKRVNSTVVAEKVSLVSELENASRNAERISKNKDFLVDFLFDANVEREWLRGKAKSLEEICQSLDNEKRDIFSVNRNLVSQFKSFQQKLDDMGRKYTDLEEDHSCLEKEMESKMHQLEQLKSTLNLEQQEHLEDEQDKALKSQLEIFILQRVIRDMEERNLTLFVEYQKHLETSENLIMNLERERLEQQVKVNDQVEKLRFGIRHMASSLKITPTFGCQDNKLEEDQILLQQATRKIQDLENSLWSTEDEKHQLAVEKSIFVALLSQLRLEAANIESEKASLDRNLKLRTEDLLLQQSEKNELKCASDHLYHQIRIGKDILSQKEMQLSETKQKLNTIEKENMELYRKLNDTSEECEKSALMLEEQILNMSEINASKNKEIECLDDAAENLELEVNRLHVQADQQRDEINLWEYEAETLYQSYQVTSILAALFEEKIYELFGACDSLKVDRDSKTQVIQQMKERLDLLELENRGVKSEVAAYLPVLVALKNSVTSLEYCTIPQKDNQETEVADLSSHQSLLEADGVPDLVELHTSIERIKTSVVKQKTLLMQECVDKDIKLEAAIQKLEQASRNRKLHHSEQYSTDAMSEILVKDIPLDQVSQCSSYDHGFVPHAVSKRDHSYRIDEIIESWGSEQDFGFDLMFEQEKKPAAIPTHDKDDFLRIKSIKDKGKCPSEEMGARFSSHQQGSKKKILERLASDAQKLSNLQVTAQDLRKKMEQLEKLKKPNDTELITIKQQLMELEEAIAHLVGSTGKLSKKAEGQARSSDEKLNVELKGAGKMQRCIISERARRGSEKIGRLQIEVQRIHFLLLQLEDRYKTKDDRKVLLKDYIYGNMRSPAVSKRKKRLCFSCVKPTPKVDDI